MRSTTPTTECIDTISFSRLHALAACGYTPMLGASRRSDGHVCIDFTHPRSQAKDPPPPITLWSDGILSSSKVLFPDKFVPEEGKAPPDWQRYILPTETDQFATFVASVKRPGLVDLYVKPACNQAKVFTTRLMMGSTICILLGVASKVILTEI